MILIFLNFSRIFSKQILIYFALFFYFFVLNVFKINEINLINVKSSTIWLMYATGLFPGYLGLVPVFLGLVPQYLGMVPLGT